MAGTSAQIPSFQVFISHSLLGTMRGFADYLLEDLQERGISTFLYMGTLPVGKDVHYNMLESCAAAQIHVPIFAPDYGTSQWCLDELATMMDCKDRGLSTVMPVYIHMGPEDLRTDNSPFARELEKFLRENMFENQRISRWKQALSAASLLKAFRLNDYGGFQGRLIKDLVKQIFFEVSDRTSVDGERYQVGLYGKARAVVQRFRLREHTTSVFVFLICGMGGIGKTTLARAIYDYLKEAFDRASFVKDCFELKDPFEIQCRLLANLLFECASDVTGGMAAVSGRLREGLRSKRVLIVLDDVIDFGSVEGAIELKDLCQGSLILLTSRNRRAFPKENDLDSTFKGEIFELPPMDSRDSFTFFCLHAFRRPYADPGFEKVAEQVVKSCGGLPLSLEVLGRHLSRRRDVGQWREAISKLSCSMYKGVSSSLKISYEALDEDEQEMFQDVACFFIGERVHRAKQFWAATAVGEPETGLENLVQRCLMKVDEDARLRMHDQLRDLGRHYSRRSKTRIWNDYDLQKALDAKSDLDQIRGIATSQDCLHSGDLSKMRALQLLFLDKTMLINGSGLLILPTLRWLKWKRCPHPTPPKDFSLPLSLAILELELKVDTLWQFPPSITDPERLRVLDMWSAPDEFSFSTWREKSFLNSEEWRRRQVLEDSERFDMLQTSGSVEKSVCVRLVGFDSLTQLPSSDGLWNGIRSLCFVGCSQLVELPQQLGSLVSLEMLCACGLKLITQLPPSLGQLKRLRVLNIGWCQKLQGLPEDLGSLESLQELQANGLESITQLPSSLSHLKRLQTLDIGGCKLLRGLPKDLGSLESLQKLRVNGLELITQLPSSLSCLKRLQKLDIGGCKQLQELPEDLDSLESLQYLHAEALESIPRLPSSLSHLKRLHTLDISGCKLLQGLPEDLGSLESLQELRANGLELITRLPCSLSNLKRLQKLDIGGCKQLQGLLEKLGFLESLETLLAHGLESLTQLPSSLSHLKRLQTLDIGGCKLLQGLHGDLGSLESLQELRANGLESITQLPSSLSNLKRLQKLYVGGCKQLQELPEDLGSLESLQELRANGLESITRLPSSLSNLKRLRKLYIGGCKQLQELPEDLGSLESLQELQANGLELITQLPSSLGHLKRLQKLDIGGCKQLQELPEDLDSLESLQHLHAEALESITRLPSSLSHLKRLHTLDIRGCKLLQGLPEDLGSLESLQELQANGLELITQLPPSLSHLKRLQKLDIGGCKQLQGLPEDLGSLESLQHLHAEALESITRLPPSLSHLKRLQTLDIRGCKLLQGLPEDLGSLESLQELRANGLESITRLPSSLSNLKRLQKLYIGGCKQLRELPDDLGSLESLQELWANDLESITRLPSSLGQLRVLRVLNVGGFKQLQGLPEDLAFLESLEDLCADGLEGSPGSLLPSAT